MSVKVTVDGKSYIGVDTVEVGGKSLSLAADVTAPSGTKTITANGSYDVSDFATAEVNVPTEGGTPPVLQELTITENGTYTPAEGYDGFSQIVANIVASGGGVGLPIHTGTQTISNPNTKKYIEHNLNLNSYVCIYWLSNLDEYIAGTEETDCKVVCGVSCYKFDLGLPTDGNSFKNMVFAKGYKQSDKSWKATMTYDEAMPSIAADENKCFIATTSNLITGTYNWIIVDLSGLNIGGA